MSGPTLSGMVFRIVEAQYVPEGAAAELLQRQSGAWDVYAITNAEGGGSNSQPLAGEQDPCWPVTAVMHGFEAIEIRADTNVVDFDLTAFVQSCQWMFLAVS